MQSTHTSPDSAIALPQIASDEPVAVIPTASVAPLEGPPDGERITMFTVAPKRSGRTPQESAGEVLDDLRERVLAQPLTSAAIAFLLGYAIARVLR